jgi:hypothetical protein
MGGVVVPWSEDRVVALAPDASALRAGRSQTTAARWTESGASVTSVWGRVVGSGASPYQVSVELAGPAFRCTCPSRKFPCKHTIGLLLRWAAGGVQDAVPPPWVADWLAEREAKAERAAARAEAGPADPAEAAAAARKRVERRADRVSAGVAELTEWLSDQIRLGLAGLASDGGEQVRAVAARMVDAQAPGLANALNRAADLVGVGNDWPGRVLAELAMAHLLLRGHAGLAGDLPAPLAETVRTQLGFTVDTADVLATGERVTDRWWVLGRVDDVGEYLVTRRTWLRGSATGRVALVLSFGPPGRPLDTSLVPATTVETALAFYPGAVPLRALPVDESYEGDERVDRPDGDPVDVALDRYADALAHDPWCARWPLLLDGVTPVRGAGGWLLADRHGAALPLRAAVDPWPLLAVSAGRPLTVAAEWADDGLHPLSCWDEERLVVL